MNINLNMKNKVALITGANSGIGFETAKALSLATFDLILLVRSQAKAQETKAKILNINPNIAVDTYIADLSDTHSIQKAAAEIGQKYALIDRIICNAGYGPDAIAFDPNGLELSFVANHLGHFVLVNALMPQVDAAPDGRVINVASLAYKLGKVDRMFQKNNTQLNVAQAYGDGKLANVLFTKALTRRLKNAKTFSLHPGVVNTGFGSNFTGFFKFGLALVRLFMISAEKGAQTTIYLATTPLQNIEKFNGAFFDKSKPVALNLKDLSDEHAEWLWAKSIEAVTENHL
jgi:retinol dehydrogenase 12